MPFFRRPSARAASAPGPWTSQVGAAPSNTRAAGGSRNGRSRTIRTGERSSRPGEPAGELGIVGQHGAGADQDRVMGGAQQVGALRAASAGDPAAVAVGRGDAAVERGGQLQRHQRPALGQAQSGSRR